MCERCQGELEQTAKMGGAIFAKCKACQHAQIVRAQPARGVLVKDGFIYHVVQAAGEIRVTWKS